VRSRDVHDVAKYGDESLATTLDAIGDELQAVHLDNVTRLGESPIIFHEQPANSVHVVLVDGRVKMLGEVINARRRTDS